MEKKHVPNHQPVDLPCEKQGNHGFFFREIRGSSWTMRLKIDEIKMMNGDLSRDFLIIPCHTLILVIHCYIHGYTHGCTHGFTNT
jgi:hypothetical protein